VYKALCGLNTVRTSHLHHLVLLSLVDFPSQTAARQSVVDDELIGLEARLLEQFGPWETHTGTHARPHTHRRTHTHTHTQARTHEHTHTKFRFYLGYNSFITGQYFDIIPFPITSYRCILEWKGRSHWSRSPSPCLRSDWPVGSVTSDVRANQGGWKRGRVRVSRILKV
jgi:hypothetical protein